MEELEPKRIIGLMSGTSCDSIDAGLCIVRPDLSCELIKGINYPYPESVRDKIFRAFSGNISVEELCQLNFEIGECFALASNILIDEFGKPDLIASHGQTIYHYPHEKSEDNLSLKSTFQIGESAVIASITGCVTVSNFRESDIAHGGQGAPLVCFADKQWFKNSAVQNIGGISNVTVVSDECLPFGFDNGCGNLMIDYCMRKFFGKKYDIDGEIAQSGNISEYWLNCLLEDEYYFNPPPKTTGREYFSEKYVENILKIAPPAKEDIIATLTALTAKTIAQSYERFIYPCAHIEQVIVGGGGAYNKFMMKLLRKYLPKHLELKTHEDFGISNNYKEAMAFALLGYCTYYKIPNNVPSCTGAEKSVVLGKISYP
ncbi:MAG: anhydro-N-acetylmuramic acid kinase [Cyanobacteria bacterium RUI128]|nr:anhydro-N-acetylmuramic acid kinase [Cyanobacteria bacterium RUI128]